MALCDEKADDTDPDGGFFSYMLNVTRCEIFISIDLEATGCREGL